MPGGFVLHKRKNWSPPKLKVFRSESEVLAHYAATATPDELEASAKLKETPLPPPPHERKIKRRA